MNAEIISTLLMIIGGVTILTNIIVQVVKTVTWDKIPTNFLALMVSEALTLAVGYLPGSDCYGLENFAEAVRKIDARLPEPYAFAGDGRGKDDL